ncbi:hypothetical protein DPMN_061337 [Dreissena polymorpha]|uniref:Uncharacterized protein n=1 Tax=Dreissena polymorpha TaxID=45954 RepID=A0A9D4HH19_DREPO|nr:hypothetical protein DPMN_061337 [Dreissena polymorpha]
MIFTYTRKLRTRQKIFRQFACLPHGLHSSIINGSRPNVNSIKDVHWADDLLDQELSGATMMAND